MRERESERVRVRVFVKEEGVGTHIFYVPLTGIKAVSIKVILRKNVSRWAPRREHREESTVRLDSMKISQPNQRA